MRHLWLSSLLAIALGLPAAAVAQVVPPPTVAEPLVVGLEPAPSPSFANLFLREPVVAVTCAGQALGPVHSERLPPAVIARPAGAGAPTDPLAVKSFSFAVAPDGRPLSIRRVAAPPSEAVYILDPVGESEVQASLASWRFPAQARSDCLLTVEDRQNPAAEAPTPLLARALALSSRYGQGPALRAALARPGDDCLTGSPARTWVFPDGRLQPPPGGRSWGAVRYSIDADGRTFDLQVLDASSEAAGAALRDSLAASTFAPSRPRTGCVAVISRYGDALGEAPPAPPELEAANRCGLEVLDRITLGALDYPDAFLDRGIEGWAVIRFDLASWGRIGGVEVVAAEPAAVFGAAAQRIFTGARVTPAFEHAAGCVQRVRFRLPGDGETPNAR